MYKGFFNFEPSIVAESSIILPLNYIDFQEFTKYGREIVPYYVPFLLNRNFISSSLLFNPQKILIISKMAFKSYMRAFFEVLFSYWGTIFFVP